VSAPNDTAKALIRSAIDAALQKEVADEFAVRCDDIAVEREGKGDAVLIALEVRDEFYARYGIASTVNSLTKGEG